ncbi:acyltransferase family protein [Dyadobacter crusticola]|uniref:acyltransferase family protein n=1 Tax=Dyadobacter crusticola TaxID=292407 RepID=UPI000A034030|nr:acyltransferase [Dyadobacter crusticola]
MHKYLHSLDYLRGLAALLVCFYHFTDRADFLSDTNVLKALFRHGHYGVEIFFIISGLVIPYSMAKASYTFSQAWTFLKKRIVRIEPPYLICVLLALSLNYLTTTTPFYVGKAFSIDYAQVFAHVGYLNAFVGKDWLNPVFWTLAVEFQYYIVIALIFPLISSRIPVVWITTLILFNGLSFYFDRNYLFNFSVFFSTGIIIYRLLVDKLTLTNFAICGAVLIAFTLYRYSYFEALVILATSTLILIPLRPTSLTTFFGNISYSLYLLHFLVGLRVINITQRFVDNEVLRSAAVFAALLVSVFAAYLYYRLIEKPCKEASQSIKYQKRNSLGPEQEPVESATPAEVSVAKV